jgi:hypothetical protein
MNLLFCCVGPLALPKKDKNRSLAVSGPLENVCVLGISKSGKDE